MYPPTPTPASIRIWNRAQGVRSALQVPVVRLHQSNTLANALIARRSRPCYDSQATSCKRSMRRSRRKQWQDRPTTAAGPAHTQRVSNEGASRTPRDITGLREGGNSAESKMSQSGRGSDRLVSRLAQPMRRAWRCFTTCRRESIVRDPGCRLLCRGQKQDRWPERGGHDEYVDEEARLTYRCYQAAV